MKEKGKKHVKIKNWRKRKEIKKIKRKNKKIREGEMKKTE